MLVVEWISTTVITPHNIDRSTVQIYDFALHVLLLSEEIYDPCRPHELAVITKVPRCDEAPVQRTNDPLSKAMDVQRDGRVDVVPPRGYPRLILDERLDRLFAHLSDTIDGLLEAKPLVDHIDANHVVRIAPGLLDVIREYVLNSK